MHWRSLLAAVLSVAPSGALFAQTPAAPATLDAPPELPPSILRTVGVADPGPATPPGVPAVIPPTAKPISLPTEAGALPTEAGAPASTPPASTPPVSGPAPSSAPISSTTTDPCPTPLNLCQPKCGPQVWFSAEYLMWWVKAAPMQPLITEGPSTDPLAGSLGQKSTQILFGGQSADFGINSGVRLSGGAWLDSSHTWGLDGSVFAFGQNARTAAFSGNGSPLASLAQPVTIPGGMQEAYSTSLQGLIAGSIWSSTSTQLFGWDANVLRNIYRTSTSEIDLLVGVRQYGLNETLGVASDIQNLTPNVLTFGGVPINMGDHILTVDQFRAQSNFYGPQFGGKVTMNWDRFGFDLTGKVAIGVSQENYQIGGSTTLIPAAGGPPNTLPGGILAQTTNIGSYYSNKFAVAPEADLNLHYDVTSWARLNFGYTFLYISSVARPGLVVDRNVDPGRVPSDQSYGLGTSTNNPSFSFHDTGYWAQGLNFGLTLRY